MIAKAPGSRVAVRPASLSDRLDLHNLLHYEKFSHRHMDWQTPLEWLGVSPFLVAQAFGRTAALLACPPDPPENAWIRAFAVSGLLEPDEAWHLLWNKALTELARIAHVERALAIVLDDWFEELLVRSGFQRQTEVVLLSWENTHPLPPLAADTTTIRPMVPGDLPAVSDLDRASFAPIWHHSLHTLSLALEKSVFATVSEDAGGINGYQMSTPSPFGGHLARLAVRPDRQGAGIGGALVHDVLARFQAQGALRVTVNTQANNRASLHLYQKMNFRRTGERYPIFEFPVTPSSS